MKYSLCFPGQGAQVVGMGRELYDSFNSAREIFDEADDSLSCHLTRLIFEGPENELTLTRNAQPAIMTVSLAALSALNKELGANLSPVCAAGHSLGEYTALTAAGVLKFSDSVRLVRDRGAFMQEAVPEGVGSMAALLGAKPDDVKNLCESIAPNGEISPANFNSPGQIVISGMTEYIDKAIEQAKNFGAKRAVKLSVSAPFHSKFMKPAAEKLKLEFEKISWSDAKFDIISNVNAQSVKNPDIIRELLYKQTFSPVLWEESVLYMADKLSVDLFIELGPGEVLAGLIKKCIKGANILSGGTPEKLEKIRAALEEVK
ncbi:MAG: ACP S-malonyltransferase [Synergistaceae bacterium]|nr:ACP S-malonyltransferase [Synergistaceae bacterium]